MTKEKNPQEYIEVSRDILCRLLARQVRLIDILIHALTTGQGIKNKKAFKADKEVISVILLMAQGMGVTVHSILKLSEQIDMSVRDSLVLSRSIVETGINIAYIIAGGSDKAKLAQRHAMQKSYRDLNRAGQFGDIRFSLSAALSPDPKNVPGLEEALQEFSNAKGREVRQWTLDNIDKRLKIIQEKFGHAALNFVGPIILVYRHSSEILHGTYFSAVHFWTGGTGKKPDTRHEAESMFLTTHFLSALSAALLTLRGVVEVADQRYEIDGLKRVQQENLEFFREFIEGLGASESDG